MLGLFAALTGAAVAETPPPPLCKAVFPTPLAAHDPDSTRGSSYPLSGTITAGTRWYPVTDAEVTGGALDEPRTLERDDQGAFSTSVPLVWGENRLRVTATDARDNQSEAIRTVERVDPDPPELSLDNPAEAIISTETATVSGRAQDSHSGVAAISIRAGDADPVSPAPDDEGHFTAELPLTVGETAAHQLQTGAFLGTGDSLEFASRFEDNESLLPGPGDRVHVVAINRPTGYVASERFELGGEEGQPWIQDAPDLELRPPNVRVWAERRTEIEAGARATGVRRGLVECHDAQVRAGVFGAARPGWHNAYGV